MSIRRSGRHRHWTPWIVLAVASAAAWSAAVPARAQSLLDRPPNLSANWVANRGTMQFNFLHRFTASAPPVRKVSNFPTFLLGTGLPLRMMIGAHYATNSTLAPAFPNEWELFLRALPLQQDRGAPVDLGGQVGYNVASDGLDGEVSLARRLGPIRLVGIARLLADPLRRGGVEVALGGGATVRLTRFVALAGDYVTLTDPDEPGGEKAAWSAGLHLALPSTPHTLSLHVTNTNTATLQGASRGADQLRYGFEFTVPVTLARFFGGGGDEVPTSAAGPSVRPTPAAVPSGQVARTVIRGMTFPEDRLEVTVGTTVVWTNEDALAHTVTAVDGSFDSGRLRSGDSWSYTFDTVGTVEFYCGPHPFMRGTVVVLPGR